VDLIIDANIVGKWFFDEPLKDAADYLIEQQYRFIAPDLMVSEFINIVQKNTRAQKITQVYGLEALKRFHALAIHYVPAIDLLEEAYRISCILDHPAYDCIYLAIPAKRGRDHGHR
jgi:predicted nucleic acid-binding protein